MVILFERGRGAHVVDARIGVDVHAPRDQLGGIADLDRHEELSIARKPGQVRVGWRFDAVFEDPRAPRRKHWQVGRRRRDAGGDGARDAGAQGRRRREARRELGALDSIRESACQKRL